MRLLFGMDRLPRSAAPDDPRLPGAELAQIPLRLNSEPMPPDRVAAAQGGHAERLAAAEAWLLAACGPYAPLQHRFIRVWLRFAAAHVASHRAELECLLAPFDGLYAPEDFVWSAPRPLPRAFVPTPSGAAQVDAAFWDGRQLLAVLLADRPAVEVLGGTTLRLSAAELEQDPEPTMAKRLPANFLRFWQGQALPVTPFRRTLPSLVTP